MKGCAWLATDDSRKGGQEKNRRSKAKVLPSTGNSLRLPTSRPGRDEHEHEDEDKDESLFTACALHLTEMNCSPATSPHPAVLTWLWLRPVNDYVMNLHCNNRAGSRPSFNPLLVKTICQALSSANWSKRGNINVTANVRVAVPVPVAVAVAACKVI